MNDVQLLFYVPFLSHMQESMNWKVQLLYIGVPVNSQAKPLFLTKRTILASQLEAFHIWLIPKRS